MPVHFFWNYFWTCDRTYRFRVLWFGLFLINVQISDCLFVILKSRLWEFFFFSCSLEITECLGLGSMFVQPFFKKLSQVGFLQIQILLVCRGRSGRVKNCLKLCQVVFGSVNVHAKFRRNLAMLRGWKKIYSTEFACRWRYRADS